MHDLNAFNVDYIRVVLTDIDGTLTLDGKLPESSYSSLWKLAEAGFKIIPVTGRPAGWCEMIARTWPVDGVIGENGAFYFRLQRGKMNRIFARSKAQRLKDRERLKSLRKEILAKVPGAAVASDQFSRVADLAIDFCEDVAPLSETEIEKIVSIFVAAGAMAKVSNIHVNGWFGDYDKVSMARRYLQKEFSLDEDQMKRECIFVGDSPNDEPMFEYFPHSFAVANIESYLPKLKFRPAYVAGLKEGDGFTQIANRLLAL